MTMRIGVVLLSIAFCAAARVEGPYYVILTTTNIASQSTQLTNFVASKEARGFDVTVVTNTAAGWGGGVGQVASTNIREWLQANYTNDSGAYVIDYVLLLGNPHPTSGDVPMKMSYPGASSPTFQPDYPTDLYYADLTSDWDVDGDGDCGEWEDRDTSDPPWQTEIFVGRIPFYGSTSDMDLILTKIVTYENANGADMAWRGNALLAMSKDGILFYTDKLGDWIKSSAIVPSGWNCHRIYDWGSPDTSPCTTNTVIPIWTNSAFGFVTFISHGDETGTSDEVVELDNIPALDNTRPVFMFHGACQNGHPETTNNLAYSLLLHGSVSAVACTREASYAWAWLNPPSPQSQTTLTPGFMHGFASNLVFRCEWASPALQNYKALVEPDGADAWINYLGYTLYGCPALGVYPASGFAGPVLSH